MDAVQSSVADAEEILPGRFVAGDRDVDAGGTDSRKVDERVMAGRHVRSGVFSQITERGRVRNAGRQDQERSKDGNVDPGFHLLPPFVRIKNPVTAYHSRVGH